VFKLWLRVVRKWGMRQPIEPSAVNLSVGHVVPRMYDITFIDSSLTLNVWRVIHYLPRHCRPGELSEGHMSRVKRGNVCIPPGACREGQLTIFTNVVKWYCFNSLSLDFSLANVVLHWTTTHTTLKQLNST